MLGFDFGTRRIGVAVGEPFLGSARPLTVIDAEANTTRFAAIDRLVSEWRPGCLVVGIPLAVSGEAHEMTHRAERFARQLEGRYRLPVHRVDERYSSTTAEAQLAANRQGWRARRETLDAEAAAVILQSHFASQPRPATVTP